MIFAVIVVSLLMLPIIHVLGLSGRVSRAASLLLVVLAYIVVFLVGLAAGESIRSLTRVIGALVLSVVMASMSVAASMAAALLLSRLLPLGWVDGLEASSGEPGFYNGVFGPARVVLVLGAGWVSGILIGPGLLGGVVEKALYYLVAAIVSAAVLSMASEAENIAGSLRLVGLGVAFAASTMASSALALLALAPVAHIEPRILAAIGAASGWYSLVGPLLTRINPYYGLVGFLANLFRETLHILLYPLVASRGLALPGVAMGGATSMDTGLPVIVIYGGRAASITGMVQGMVVTLAAPLLIPLLVT